MDGKFSFYIQLIKDKAMNIKTDDYRMALNLINNALHQINIAVYQVEEDLDADEVVFRIVKDESIEADLVDATKHLMDAKDKLKAILNLD